jgi:hypothetical protein
MTDTVKKPFNYRDLVMEDVRFEGLTLEANSALNLSRIIYKPGYMALGLVGERSTINTNYFSRFRVKTPPSGVMPIGEAELELVLENPDPNPYGNVTALICVLWVKAT